MPEADSTVSEARLNGVGGQLNGEEAGDRAMNTGHWRSKRCGSPAYVRSRTSAPAERSRPVVSTLHCSGQIGSAVPWWIRTGAVIRDR